MTTDWITHLLFSGAFGVVYLAEWRNTECVVKKLIDIRNDSHSVNEFLKEANIIQYVVYIVWYICVTLSCCLTP